MAILDNKVALVTGSSKRLGKATIQKLHSEGANVVVHYNHSKDESDQLVMALNKQRIDSAMAIQMDLSNTKQFALLVEPIIQQWGRLDILVNNASCFYPTSVMRATENEWDNLMDINLKAPFFLSQACAPFLAENQGCIINMVDVYAYRPLKRYPIYSITKAALKMLTESLALELGGKIRVNGIAPGIILWPEHSTDSDAEKEKLIVKTALKLEGNPRQITDAILFLIAYASYTTGHIISVDGGRLLNQ